jgi:hypothetical protein
MAFTDGGLVEPLILAVFLFALLALGLWGTLSFVRGVNEQRRAVQQPRQALNLAKDALAAVISDAAVYGETRNSALNAYEKVSDALRKEKSIT